MHTISYLAIVVGLLLALLLLACAIGVPDVPIAPGEWLMVLLGIAILFAVGYGLVLIAAWGMNQADLEKQQRRTRQRKIY